MIPLWWDMACLAALSLAIYIGAMAQGGKVASPVTPNSESTLTRFQAPGLASAVEGR